MGDLPGDGAPVPDEEPAGEAPELPPLRTLPHLRGLLVGEFASSAGSAMAVLGIAFLSYDDSGSVLHTVAVTAAYSLPVALLGMYAGRLSQRTSRRRILVTSYSFKMVIYLVMAALAAADALKVPGLMVSSVLAGVAAAFTSPAWMRYERDLIPADRLAEANGAFGSAAAGAGLVGALAGSALMGLVGVWSVFLVDALSYLPFLWVVVRAHVVEELTDEATRVSLGAALRYVRRTRSLWRAFGRIALLSLLVAPVAQLLPAIASNVSESKSTLGILSAVFGLGAMSVAWVISRLERHYDEQRIINGAFGLTSVILFGFGLLGDPLDSPQLWGVVVASLIPLGLLLTLAQSVIAAVVQVQVDPDMEGPVFALYAIVYTVVAPLGGFALGLVADHWGVWLALIVAGAAMLVLTVALAVLGRRHGVPVGDDPAPPGDDARLAPAHASAPARSRLHRHPARLRLHHLQSGLFPLAHEHRDEGR